jgi:flagellar biosynthesis/type III secretory pathway protein FliH
LLAADYVDSGNIVARLLTVLMKYPREQRLDVCQRALEGLIQLEPNLDRRLKYSELVLRYGRVKPPERIELERRLTKSTSQEAIMGLFQEARDEARLEGLRQGRQEGRQEALREGLLKAIQFGLELKFGVDGLALMREIQGIQDVDLLNTVLEALKVAKQADELRCLYRETPSSH